ncbi:Retrovirus-related Pol polyprotein from transposon gypsy [Dictyocoela muelleri]|nr:Retrovirus-related Pol polyprotein from transposon gypsy [Dictyocoela muelleri]
MMFLTEKLAKYTQFSWNEADAVKLSQIVNDIESKVKLIYPNLNIDFTLDTDASEQAIGAVLSQEGNSIGFYSLKFTESEKKLQYHRKGDVSNSKSFIAF